MSDELALSAFIIHRFAFIILTAMPDSRDITAEHARAAAQIEADVGVEHIADVYAKGLLDAAEGAGRTAAVIEEFDAVMSEVIDKFPKLEAVLDSGLVLPEEKESILGKTLAGRVSPLTVNFLKVVARHGRLDCLRAIHRQTHAAYDRLRRRIPVRLTTATPVSGAMLAKIVAELRGKLEGEPIVEQQVDPSLIGGAVLRVGDVIYDGSIANQLQDLRQKVSDRSLHEIQSRRDRFRHSAGN
jgi:F-type H+-transporting ATPase subunit delta